MAKSIFPGYEKRLVSIEDQTISVHIGGTGTPLLLLHGYPQNHGTWIKLAVPLARNFTCVIADLPGYGESFIPADAPDHEGFSKRRMAENLLSAMVSLGYATFNVMGHDRGARVAYRMALDHPEAIHRLVIIEVIPTSDMWDAFNAEIAMKAYHWSFLAQPFPLPETLIDCDPVFYLDWTLRSWTKSRSLDEQKVGPAYHAPARPPQQTSVSCCQLKKRVGKGGFDLVLRDDAATSTTGRPSARKSK